MEIEIPEPIEVTVLVALFTGLSIAPFITVAAIIDGYSVPMIALATVSTPIILGLTGLWIGFCLWALEWVA
jgi:hypothetical protein